MFINKLWPIKSGVFLNFATNYKAATYERHEMEDSLF